MELCTPKCLNLLQIRAFSFSGPGVPEKQPGEGDNKPARYSEYIALNLSDRPPEANCKETVHVMQMGICCKISLWPDKRSNGLGKRSGPFINNKFRVMLQKLLYNGIGLL